MIALAIRLGMALGLAYAAAGVTITLRDPDSAVAGYLAELTRPRQSVAIGFALVIFTAAGGAAFGLTAWLIRLVLTGDPTP